MSISASHLPKVLDRLTSDQCLEVLHHRADTHQAPRDQTVAYRMFLGLPPATARSGTVWLLERDHGGRQYRLTDDGAQIKAALEARA